MGLIHKLNNEPGYNDDFVFKDALINVLNHLKDEIYNIEDFENFGLKFGEDFKKISEAAAAHPGHPVVEIESIKDVPIKSKRLWSIMLLLTQMGELNKDSGKFVTISNVKPA
jgi:hypothetical protein